MSGQTVFRGKVFSTKMQRTVTGMCSVTPPPSNKLFVRTFSLAQPIREERARYNPLRQLNSPCTHTFS